MLWQIILCGESYTLVIYLCTMDFELKKQSTECAARTGEITTAHGCIATPVFMPVGTAGAIKAVSMEQMESETAARIILGNTYHLYLRPGTEVLKKAGGLHCFGTWKKPILTDSGGFQVFSLTDRRKITEEGVTFSSHIDGSKHLFTPEKVMDIERAIGADIVMAFDECCPGDADYNYAKKSLDITERWLKRCCDRFYSTEPLYGYEQALFPIVQGCVYPELRKRAANNIAELNAPGNAIGGLAVGEPAEVMYQMIELTNEILPKDKPRYLMGVGTPANILEAIERGVDMFDCIMPTRNARNGQLFTHQGIMNIKNAKWADCFEPIDSEGTTSMDLRYSRAYLHHLFRAGEILGLTIASVHNISFYLWLVDEARRQIEADTFLSWKRSLLPVLMRRI